MDPSDPLSPLIPREQHPVYLTLFLTIVMLLIYTQTPQQPNSPLQAITISIFRTTAVCLIPLPSAALLLLALLNAPLHTATLTPLVAFLASLVRANAPSETHLHNLALRFATPLPCVHFHPAALATLISSHDVRLFHGSRIPFFSALSVHHRHPPILSPRSKNLQINTTESVVIAERTHRPHPHPRFAFLSYRNPNPGAEVVLSLKECLRIKYLSKPIDNVIQMWEWAHNTGFGSLKESLLPSIAVELGRRECANADEVEARTAALAGFGNTYDTPTEIVMQLAVEANLVAILGIGLQRGIDGIEAKLRRLEESILHALIEAGGLCMSRGGRSVIAVPFRAWPADRIGKVVVEWLCVSCGMPVIGGKDDDEDDDHSF